MEEDRFGFAFDEDTEEVVKRFENMRRNNENYFFDVSEFETLIDFYLDSDNSTRAAEAAQIASDQHPYSVSIQLRKARIMIDKGRAVEALKIIRAVESIEPGNYEVYIAKGTAFAMLGNITGARKMFDYALELGEDEPENILFSIVSVLQNLNYYEQLIPYLIKLEELEPDYNGHVYDLAYAYDRTGNLKMSIEYYLKYIEDEPFSDSAWYNLGIIYNRTEEYEKALEAYDYSLAINPQNTFSIFNKANILSNMGRYEEAIAPYHEFLEYEDESPEAFSYLAECYEKTNEYELSRKYYLETLELEPTFAEAWFGLGILALKAGTINESQTLFRKAVKLDDENPEYWFYLGKSYLECNEVKEAVRCFRESLRIDPYYDEVWLEIIKIIFKNNAIDKALQFLVKAHKITGDVPGINYILGALYLHNGLEEDAWYALGRALSADKSMLPDYSEFYPEEMLSPRIQELIKENSENK